jgi:hypothetical protein
MTIIPDNWREVAWKTAIIDGAPEALAYFIPCLPPDMDTSQDIIPMTTGNVLIERVGGKKGLDSVVFLDVPMRGGGVTCVFCVIGGQSENADDVVSKAERTYFRLVLERSVQRWVENVVMFVLYTGDSENVNFYEESAFGTTLRLDFKTFHIPSYDVEELRRDDRPFARVMYAGRMAYESADDPTLREKYARELLAMADGNGYDDAQRKVILEFSQRIFHLSDPKISDDLKAAYDKRTKSLKNS